VHFVPFGVDTHRFRPSDRPAEVDVAMVGADPHRDHELVLRVAGRMPDVSYRVIAADEAALPSDRPPNVQVDTSVPFARATEALERARVVALPVRQNSYSGATTVLLQALALGKPVVVTRTRAIAEGYGLVDGETCRFVPAGDAAALERALAELLADPDAAAALGRRGRTLVEEQLGWDRFATRIRDILVAAAGQETA
jgi:glycosyltransferase involved in cell wall biosynthesis